jgi:hypothetical protein
VYVMRDIMETILQGEGDQTKRRGLSKGVMGRTSPEDLAMKKL